MSKLQSQTDVALRCEREIPQHIRDAFPDLTYLEMAERPECAEYADLLRELDDAWWAAQE